MDINYIGEHAAPGQLGNWFVQLSFVFSILAAVAYYLGERNRDTSWLQLGRWLFRLHSASVVAVIGLLFYLILQQYFEYDYVWKHSNRAMEAKYVFACFWEGQEGSFLLWMFWHLVIGNLLIWRNKSWEGPVLSVLSLVQVFLSSMLLGLYVAGQKIGSNPFLLIRELPENLGLPWTQSPNYLSLIPQFADGRGLNPLLQNYWMTIHPPTLFLGFALTVVPFCFAIAGLWRGDLTGWMKAARSWSFSGVLVLGVGILMGGAWAYEALNFGGFWAWDPVENASLVPWLTLVGAAHLIIVNLRKPQSVFLALFLSMISFILVLYSTFLTRSGVLGDSSVHSFTDNGMTGQLLLYLLTFLLLMTALLIRRPLERVLYSGISASMLVITAVMEQKVALILVFLFFSALALVRAYRSDYRQVTEEEKLWSREFWMFIGSLVLGLSALQISFSTSTPVINLLIKPFSETFGQWGQQWNWEWLIKLGKANFAPPSNAIQHYNKWQIPFAFLTAMLIAVTQFFAYRDSDIKKVLSRLAMPFGLAVILTIGLGYAFQFSWSQPNLLVLLFSGIFAVTANAHYWLVVVKKANKMLGSSMAHLGFALILVGSLISAGKSVKLSENKTTFDITSLGKDFKNNEDMLLFKGDTVAMGDYFVTYKGKKTEGINQLYQVDYFSPKPNRYLKGQLVLSQGVVFECTREHVPSSNFLNDQANYWKVVDQPSSEQLRQTKLWNAGRAGDLAFTLYPRIQMNAKFGNVPEPSTKHFLHKDIYTHIRWAELERDTVDAEGYFKPQDYQISKGDTIFSARTLIVFEGMNLASDPTEFRLLPSDLVAVAHLKIIQADKQEIHANPIFILRDNNLVIPDVTEVKEAGLKIAISEINPAENKVSFSIAEHQDNTKEFVVMQAIMFPGINVLWMGIVLMGLGTLIAVLQRIRASLKNER